MAQRMKRLHLGKKWRRRVPGRGNSVCEGSEEGRALCLCRCGWDLFEDKLHLEVRWKQEQAQTK